MADAVITDQAPDTTLLVVQAAAAQTTPVLTTASTREQNPGEIRGFF
jgi:hypothetical protein